MVDGLEAKAVSQTMLEKLPQSGLLHDIAGGGINGAGAGPIADVIYRSVLGCHAGFMRLTPLVADITSEEGTGKLGPIAIDANLHLDRYRISPLNRGVGSQVESPIRQGSSCSGHDVDVRLHML